MHALWDSLKTFDVQLSPDETGRLLTVQSLHSRAVCVVQQPDHPRDHGTLVMSVWPPRMVAQAKRLRRPLRANQVQHVQYVDVYWLLRGLTHATESYLNDTKGELVRLSEVEALFYQLNGLITELRKDNLQALMGEIKRCIARTLTTLTPRVVIPEKEEATDFMLKIDEIYDSLQRVNPSALLAQLVAARRRIVQRQASIDDIVGEFSTRRHAVLLVTSFLEAQVRIADDFLNRLLARWNMNVSCHPQLIAHQLRQSAQVYRTFTVRPFLETFTYVADEYDRAAHEIEQLRYVEAKALLGTALASFQLRILRADLERTVFTVSKALRAKRPFDVPATVQALVDTRSRLEAIDCTRMRSFSVPTTIAGLRCAEAFFGQTVNREGAYRQGYEALRQIATTI